MACLIHGVLRYPVQVNFDREQTDNETNVTSTKVGGVLSL